MSSSSETYVNSDDGSISEEFHKHFWKYAIGGIIVILIGLMAYKIISVLLVNPLTNAVNDLVGDFGLLLKDFTKGCCSQDDCPNKYSTKDDCESGCGCGWDNKASKCANTTDAEVDTGGFISFKCPLFLTLIVGFGAWFLVKIVGGIYSIVKNRPAKKTMDDYSRLTGTESRKNMEEWRTEVNIDMEEWKKNKGEEKYSKAKEQFAAERISQIKYNQKFVEGMKKLSADKWKAADQQAKEAREASRKSYRDAESDANVEEDERDIEKVTGKDV